MFNDYDLAQQALQIDTESNEGVYRGLSMAITAFSLLPDTEMQEERRTQTLQSIKQAMGVVAEPYAHAIATYLISGNWMGVLHLQTLNLRFRVGIAFLYLNDSDLSANIEKETQNGITTGDVQGVVLTGLNTNAIDLFEAYIEKNKQPRNRRPRHSLHSPSFHNRHPP